MAVLLNPYLHFDDTARKAMEFYRSVFGGELTLSTFGEYQMNQDPADADKVMHASLATDLGLTLMGADIPASMRGTEPAGGPSATVSLSGGPEDDAALRGYWAKLIEGGSVTEPLEVAPWGDAFGMCTDQFGVDWMVNIAGPGGAGPGAS